jgi:hypothetical protein
MNRLWHHSSELGCCVHRSGNRAVGSYHELAGLDHLGAFPLANPCTQFFGVFNRDTVSDLEGKIVVGVSFSRVGIAVGVASDDFDSELVELLEPLFCIG